MLRRSSQSFSYQVVLFCELGKHMPHISMYGLVVVSPQPLALRQYKKSKAAGFPSPAPGSELHRFHQLSPQQGP